MLTTPRVATSKYNLALPRRQRNVTDIARQLFREREQIYITVYGPDHSKQIYASTQGLKPFVPSVPAIVAGGVPETGKRDGH